MNKHLVAILFSLASLCAANAQNPYLPLWEHLPDGEPRVFEDPDRPGKFRAYIIGSHDLAYHSYCGPDIRMWSAPVEDLTDWRDEGAIFTYHIDGQWDTMFAPDLVEVKHKDGTKEYYLYPHSRGPWREPMVCKGSRPDGPFTPVNLDESGRKCLPGSVLGFDPSVYVEQITDPADPDYATGFRAYGFWGFQRSLAAQLDPNTMYSVRPGTEVIPYFIPASKWYGEVRDPEGTQYPALYKEQKLTDFNFFEASSIRKVGNKYVMIFSGYSGPDYGLGSTNSSLRYAYGDTPLGPWRSGGVLVDSRGVVLNEDGSRLQCTNAGHNTHGSIEKINDQWYVFYHRPPRGFGFARQAMVAPISIICDERPVSEGGRVLINAYDPYAPDGKWMAKAANGDTYTGAEVTSEGFRLFGLPPYAYYSAGYACYLSNIGSQQDSWDIWTNDMPIHVRHRDIIGYKYFGFGGLSKATKGLKPFEGTKRGNETLLNLFLQPTTDRAFKISVWLDGPWANETWQGKKLGEIQIPAGAAQNVGHYILDVAESVEGLAGKHAIFLVAEGNGTREPLCILQGLGFSKAGMTLSYPAPPAVTITVNGQQLELPDTPVRFTPQNGICGYDQYEVSYTIPSSAKRAPKVKASCDNPEVKIRIIQPAVMGDNAVVKFDYNGKVKIYTVKMSKT